MTAPLSRESVERMMALATNARDECHRPRCVGSYAIAMDAMKSELTFDKVLALCQHFLSTMDRGDTAVRGEAVASGWIPIDTSQPVRNSWAIYWHVSPNGGFPDIAHEWRDEEHRQYASHWLPYQSPDDASDSVTAEMLRRNYGAPGLLASPPAAAAGGNGRVVSDEAHKL